MQLQGTISQWGNGKAVRLPKKFLDVLGLKENDYIDISLSITDNAITIKPISKVRPKNYDELFEGYTGTYQSTEFDFGEDIGEENVWY